MFRHILVAYDDSPGARNALKIGVELARWAADSARVTVVAVEPPLPHYGATVGEVQADQEFEERRCRRWLDAAQGYAEDRDVKVAPRSARGTQRRSCCVRPRPSGRTSWSWGTVATPRCGAASWAPPPRR